jgi:hypothetical protein
MTEAEFSIRIKTILEKEGLVATADQIDRVAAAAAKADETILEGHGKIEISHREMRESLGAVGRAFGGLADVGLWLSPVTAALAAILWLVEKLKEHFSAINDKIREYIETSRQIRSDHMEALEAATRATADAMAEYARQARAAAEEQQAANQAMQDRIALNDAYIDGLKKVEESEEKAFEAEIERDVATGKITQEEGQRRQDMARERLQADTANLDIQREQQRIAEHQRQLADATARIPQEQAARDAALFAAEHPSVSASDTKHEIERQSKILAAQNAKVAASLAEADQHRTPGTFARDTDAAADIAAGKPIGTMAKASATIAERQAAQDQKLADATAAYIRSLQAKQDASDQAVKDAKSEADIQNKKLQQDQEIVRAAPDRIAQETALADVHRQTASTVNRWNVRANVTHEGDMRSPAEIAASRESGPQAAVDASAAVARAREIEFTMSGQRPQDRSSQDMAELHDLLNRIIGLQENHASELNSQRGDLSEQRIRISALESQSQINRGSQP